MERLPFYPIPLSLRSPIDFVAHKTGYPIAEK